MQATSNVNAKGKTGMTGKKEERCLEKWEDIRKDPCEGRCTSLGPGTQERRGAPDTQPVSGQDHPGPCVPDKRDQEPMSCCCVEVYGLMVFPLIGNGPKFNNQNWLTGKAVPDSGLYQKACLLGLR